MKQDHKTIKIAFFLPALDGAGAEKVFVTLANNIVNHGYAVDFVLAKATGVFLSALDPKINAVDLGHKHVIHSFFGLGHYLRSQRPEILISGLSNANAAALAAGKIYLPSCKIIITQHANWPEVLANNPTRKERFVYLLSKLLYPFATRIVAVSSVIAEEIMRMGRISPEKVLYIYNPVVTQDLLEKARQPVNHPWLNKKTVPVLLGVGRLVEQKDFETLIRAFALVLNKMDGRLLILGDGPERQKLEKLVQELGLAEKIDLPGFNNNPYAFMTHADQFVLSSRFEGLPTVLIEALACGVSVVSTDCISGPAEILDGGKFGRLVPIEDAKALSDAIIESLQNPIDTELLKKRAELFSVENASMAYLKLIEEVLSAK